MDYDNDGNMFAVGIVLGMVIGAVVSLMIAVSIMSDSFSGNSLVKSQKEFILDNATYKCTKTNELLEEK